MQLCVVRRSYSDGGGCAGFGLLFLTIRSRKHSFPWIGFSPRSGDRLTGGIGPVSAPAARASGGTDQDHYAVLGIHRLATAKEVKHAYRRLAREHHPDVNRNQQAGEIFKKIRLAYEVLSDEVKRARYDLTHEHPFVANKSRYSNYENRVIHNWEELRRAYKREKKKSGHASWSYQTEAYQDPGSFERRPFVEALQFAFLTLLFMQMIGCRASLTLSGMSALLDKQLDAGYKTGYVIAWILGGRAGIFLALCICFASWLCGKKNSSIVALVVVAMWVGANITRFLPLPQGAVLTLIYMSMKLQVDSK